MSQSCVREHADGRREQSAREMNSFAASVFTVHSLARGGSRPVSERETERDQVHFHAKQDCTVF